MLAVGIWYVWSPRTRISDVAVTLMGPIYTGFMLSAIVLLRDAVPGFAGAAFSGRFARPFGSPIRLPTSWVAVSAKHKDGSPNESPPKRRSGRGLPAGILGSVLIWLILWATHFYKLSLPYALLCGVVVSILGVSATLSSRASSAVWASRIPATLSRATAECSIVAIRLSSVASPHSCC